MSGFKKRLKIPRSTSVSSVNGTICIFLDETSVRTTSLKFTVFSTAAIIRVPILKVGSVFIFHLRYAIPNLTFHGPPFLDT